MPFPYHPPRDSYPRPVVIEAAQSARSFCHEMICEIEDRIEEAEAAQASLSAAPNLDTEKAPIWIAALRDRVEYLESLDLKLDGYATYLIGGVDDPDPTCLPADIHDAVMSFYAQEVEKYVDRAMEMVRKICPADEVPIRQEILASVI